MSGTDMAYKHRKPEIYGAWLPAGTIARFATGLRWPEILALDTRKRSLWWTHAVGEAEDRGLLVWDRDRQTWTLTDEGRAYARDVS